MDVTIYTKKDCDRCKAMKEFLNKYDISYTEKDIMNPEVGSELVKNDYITEHFCDENECIVITPVINIDGKWMYKEFFGINGFAEYRAKRFFNIG
ncbi:MAG: hypothetical protein GF329_09360 [Candidatus Lokiarchaeota archaeon]|nr:hypothetical protein [Candidatus Lokiarchaeota archaeon]